MEDLKARNKELESRNDSLHSILKKITHPLNQCQIPSKIFEKIINNEFEYEVKTIYEPMRNESYIYIKYIVKGGIEHD